MASEKFLAVIGIDEADTAHLRLLLRMATDKLAQRWRWGSEENADMVIVDPAQLQGQFARNRAYNSGRRCAIFSVDEPLRDGELRLAKPLKVENLIQVLAAISSGAAKLNSPVLQQKADFYDPDTFNPDFELEDGAGAEVRTRRSDANPAPGLDELFKPDSESRKPQFAVKVDLGPETRIQSTPARSQRSEHRVADSIDGVRKQKHKSEGINISASMEDESTSTNNTQSLREYLNERALGGPSSITLADAPELTLDPKTQTFHSRAGMAALVAYCKQTLPRSLWRKVTSSELARIRDQQPGRPYSLLVWLDVLTHSGGRLASHLDPGGRYKLKRWPETTHDFPSHHRVATALSKPAKLNEIANSTGVPMGDVFDLVNAYDAIGLIEVEPRTSRHAESEPQGLLARLGNVFRRK
ncbi:MAG: hypothetical protein ABI304_06605 [Rudaea sp.]